MHVYWSHLEARNACPIHFTLPAAQSSSYDICILCSTRCYNCPPISEMAADLRHLLSGKAGGLKKKKRPCDCTAIMCDCLKNNMGCSPMCLLLLPSQSDPPPPTPSLCLSAAYRCYAHYLKIEVSQSHPVMKAFCGMLLQSMSKESNAAQRSRDLEEGLWNKIDIILYIICSFSEC